MRERGYKGISLYPPIDKSRGWVLTKGKNMLEGIILNRLGFGDIILVVGGIMVLLAIVGLWYGNKLYKANPNKDMI